MGNNQYAYCVNNPVRYHDDQGRMVEEDAINEDPEEQLFPDKDALGPTKNAGQKNGSLSQGVGQTTTGPSRAPKQAPPGSIYIQIASDGTDRVVSQTTYNEYGVRGQRIDYLGHDHGVGLPHIHIYSWGIRDGNLVPQGEKVLPYRKE